MIISRLKSKNIALLLSLSLLILGISGGVAVADNALGGKTDTQQVLILPQTPADIQRDEAKKKAVEVFIATMNKTNTATSSAQGITPNILYTTVLGVSASAQKTIDYCGPASAYQLLKYLGVQSYNGRSLSQDNLATDLHWNGQTSFPGYCVSTLNNWSGSSYYTTVSNPSVTTVWNDFYYDIGHNHPLICDTHMSSTTGYLPGYSGSEWWHYVTGDGIQFDDYNSKSDHYVDPNNFRSGCYGPHWVSNVTMASVVHDRGIAF